MSSTRVTLQYAQRVLLLTLVYVATAKLGLAMDAVGGFATLVWPPSGLAIAALLLLGAHFWPAVTLGAFIANVWTGATPAVALGIALGNTLEAVIARGVLSRFEFSNALARLRDVAA